MLKKSTVLVFTFILMLFIMLFGCGQVEYPEKLYTEKLQNKDFDHFEIINKTVMEFREGYLTEFAVSGIVPEPGNPILSVEGLPTGAQFDTTSGRIIWTPPIGTLKGKTYKVFDIIITLTSSANTELRLRRQAAILLGGANS